MIGTNLDKYEVLQKIGEGGMATVYRGRHATLDRDVAIKVLHPHLSSSTRNRKRFEREARAIEQLRHANILEIFDYSGVDAGDCYIITEFVDGQTLTTLMEHCRRLPSEVAVMVGIALAEALAYAHGQGILHRDLKPDNVMVRRDGQIKLMDFGIARFLDETQVTLTGALVGSPAFMSPEQAKEAPLDARSDLFSLGTLLFFLVTGHLPFSGSNPSLILKNIIEGNRPTAMELTPAMSPSFADVIERLLAVPPHERFPTADAVADALRTCLEDVDFPTDDAAWSLSAFLTDPEGYTRALEGLLTRRLLTVGQARMAQGDALGGLRLVNRLLCMDEANEEALALVQQMHGVDHDPSTGPRRLHGWAAVVLLLTFGSLAIWSLWPRSPSKAVDVVPTTPARTSPAVVAPPKRPPMEVVPVETPPKTVQQTASPRPTPSASEQQRRPEPAPAPRPAKPKPPVQPASGSADPPEDVTPASPEEGAADAEAANQPGCIAIRTPAAPSDVFMDGRSVWTSRDQGCLSLPPGAYEVEILGSMIEPRTYRFTLAAGERRVPEIVPLQLKPATLTFDARYADRCTVFVDGIVQGTVGNLDRRVPIPNPQADHTVRVDCGKNVWIATYDGIGFPTLAFDGRTAP